MSIDISKLSLEELVSLKTDVEKQIVNLQKQQKTAFLSDFRAKARALGFSFDELLEASQQQTKKPRKSVPDKYKDPESGKTWTGRGKPPKWMQAHLEKGGVKDDLLIDTIVGNG